MAMNAAQIAAMEEAMRLDATNAEASQPEAPSGNGLGATIGERLKTVGDTTITGINSALNTATFGLTGLAERGAGGLINSIGQDDTTFMQGVDETTRGIQDREDRNWIATLLGEAVGTVAGAGKIEAAAKIGNSIYQRLALAAGVSAAENLGARAGHGEVRSTSDAMMAAGLGIVGGAGGQALGEVIEPLSRGIGKRLGLGVEDAAQTVARENITGVNPLAPESASGRMSMPDNGPAGLMREAIEGGTMRQDQILADQLGPRMVTETKTMARNAELVPELGSLRSLMDSRTANLDSSAKDLADTFLRPDLASAGDAAALSKDAIAAARPQYKAMIESPAATAFSVPRSDLADLIAETVPSNSSAPAKDTGRWLQQLIDRSGDVSEATGSVDNISPDVLIEVKKAIDTEIGKLMRGEVTSIDAGSLSRLSTFKSELIGIVNEAVPDYAASAGQYADELRLSDLSETGAEMFRSTKTDADSMQGFIESIGSEGESASVIATQRQAFIDGGLQAMMLKNGAGSVTELRRLMRPGSNEYAKLSVMIPEGNLASYAAGAETLMGEAATAKTITSAVDTAAGRLPSAGVDSAVYAAGGAMSAVAQRFGPAAYMLGKVLGDPTPARVNQILMDLYSAQGPEAAEAALDAIMAAPAAKQTSMVGGLLGNITAQALPLSSSNPIQERESIMSVPTQPWEAPRQGGSIMGN